MHTEHTTGQRCSKQRAAAGGALIAELKVPLQRSAACTHTLYTLPC